MAIIDFSFVGQAKRDLIVELLQEMMREMGPPKTAQRVCEKLPHDTDRALADPQVVFILASDAQNPVGIARADILEQDPIFRLRPENRCGYVDQMYVRADYRGKGIGRQLLEQCERWFKEQGLTHCLLHAAPKALSFYADQGYLPNREMFKRL